MSKPIKLPNGLDFKTCEGGMTMRLKIFEFLAYPAHLWLMAVARLCGMTFEHGPADDKGNFTGRK